MMVNGLKIMREELDQLEKNNSWELVHRDKIEKKHQPLGSK